MCGRDSPEWPFVVNRSAGIVVVTETGDDEGRLRNTVNEYGWFFVRNACLPVRVGDADFTPVLPRRDEIAPDGKSFTIGGQRIDADRSYTLPFATEVGSHSGEAAASIGLPAACWRRPMSMGYPADPAVAAAPPVRRQGAPQREACSSSGGSQHQVDTCGDGSDHRLRMDRAKRRPTHMPSANRITADRAERRNWRLAALFCGASGGLLRDGTVATFGTPQCKASFSTDPNGRGSGMSGSRLLRRPTREQPHISVD